MALVGNPRVAVGERLRVIAVNVLFTAGIALMAYVLLLTWQEKRRETLEKEREVAAMRAFLAKVVAQNDDLKRQVRFLQTPEGVEKVARERLGLIRVNETSYVVINAPTLKDAPEPRSTPKPPAEPAGSPLSRWLGHFWNSGD
ncbi:MAG: septum formation initiator family protein [Armatimonadetes bacterium]|nr:septum formation initiator family protein [Armatimonadota bacterium]